ncbi:unnamed protein product [Gadus morhua 'NCC']
MACGPSSLATGPRAGPVQSLLGPTLLVLLVSGLGPAFCQKIYTNTWAVQIPGGQEVAEQVASKHSFVNLGHGRPKFLDPFPGRVLGCDWPDCEEKAGLAELYWSQIFLTAGHGLPVPLATPQWTGEQCLQTGLQDQQSKPRGLQDQHSKPTGLQDQHSKSRGLQHQHSKPTGLQDQHSKPTGDIVPLKCSDTNVGTINLLGGGADLHVVGGSGGKSALSRRKLGVDTVQKADCEGSPGAEAWRAPGCLLFKAPSIPPSQYPTLPAPHHPSTPPSQHPTLPAPHPPSTPPSQHPTIPAPHPPSTPPSQHHPAFTS